MKADKVKVVIPAAGLGTRLLPTTKEQPKEMLPVFARTSSGKVCLKPLLQLVFEQLYDFGFREFYFVIGREKRAIEDHFTPEFNYVTMVEEKGKGDLATDLKKFYEKIENSSIVWVNQPEPRGFGDAVLRTATSTTSEPFLVHAGDTYILSDHDRHLKSLLEIYDRPDVDIVCILQEVEDPRQYGVAEIQEAGNEAYMVKKVTEKPKRPTTNLAIMPVYVFPPAIHIALKKTPPGKGNEIQLTDAIQKLIDEGRGVYAIKLGRDDIRLDIGMIETYWTALELSYRYARK